MKPRRKIKKKKKRQQRLIFAIFSKSMFVVRKLFAEGVDKIDRLQFSAIIAHYGVTIATIP